LNEKSGGLAGSSLHVARSTCRRAERQVIELLNEGESIKGVVRYLNRLSDFLFVAARFAAQSGGHTERVWVKAATEKGEDNTSPNETTSA
jgi:cob(I)alamin adenosyltransferase